MDFLCNLLHIYYNVINYVINYIIYVIIYVINYVIYYIIYTNKKMHINVTPSHLALVLVFLGKFLALLVQVFQITFSQKRGADKRVTSN